MFNLGFTMEELMFPENYQYNFLLNIESNCLTDKFDETSPAYDSEEQMIVDDDWLTIKQLNSDPSSTDNNFSFINDQTLPLLNNFSDDSYFRQVKSLDELDGTITALLLPNRSIKVARDKHSISLPSDVIPTISLSPPCDQRLLTIPTTINQKQQLNIHSRSKSSSSLSFCTQSSISTTTRSSSSIGEMSPNSNDSNEVTSVGHSIEAVQKLSHHHHHHHKNDESSNIINRRRRRKRTIFSAADIEYLKEAFIQNPKPNQQDIAVLSEQLGHDSYVIRVWFYNKRQATKKRND